MYMQLPTYFYEYGFIIVGVRDQKANKEKNHFGLFLNSHIFTPRYRNIKEN